MEYSPTLFFVGFNSKMREIPETKKRKRAIAAVYVATESCVSRKISKLIAKELCREKRQRAAIENGKNLTIQLRQRNFLL